MPTWKSNSGKTVVEYEEFRPGFFSYEIARTGQIVATGMLRGTFDEMIAHCREIVADNGKPTSKSARDAAWAEQKDKFHSDLIATDDERSAAKGETPRARSSKTVKRRPLGEVPHGRCTAPLHSQCHELLNSRRACALLLALSAHKSRRRRRERREVGRTQERAARRSQP